MPETAVSAGNMPVISVIPTIISCIISFLIIFATNLKMNKELSEIIVKRLVYINVVGIIIQVILGIFSVILLPKSNYIMFLAGFVLLLLFSRIHMKKINKLKWIKVKTSEILVDYCNCCGAAMPCNFIFCTNCGAALRKESD